MPFDLIDVATAPAISGTFGAPLTSYGKTLTILKAELTTKLKGRDDSTALLAGWINDAYREVCAELDFPELRGQLSFNTVLGQAAYKLPAGVYVLLGGSYVDATLPNGGYPLTPMDEDFYKMLEVTTSTISNPPTHYLQYQTAGSSYIVLWPTPNGVFKIVLDFKVTPAALVNATDSPLLDERWHYPIRLRATALALEDLDDTDGATKAFNKYLASMRPKLVKDAEIKSSGVFGISMPRTRAQLTSPPSR